VASLPPLDLRGTPCPLNYVKTRLRLEGMAVGQEIEVWLDAGEPQRQVPRSLRLDGQAVTELPAHESGSAGAPGDRAGPDGGSAGGWCRIRVRREV
jgi:TusA-related sulfurtransferase